MALEPLTPALLYRPCDPTCLGFSTTRDLEAPTEPPGQERAMEALRFGAAIRQEGYNIFALGPVGLGKRSSIREVLERRAKSEPPGDDFCYVHNFENQQEPKYLRMPPGRAVGLRRDLEDFVEAVGTRLPAAFHSEDYERRTKDLEKKYEAKREKAFSEAKVQVERLGLAVLRSPTAFALVPVKDGAPVDPDKFDQLSEEEKQRYKTTLEHARGFMEAFAEQLPTIEHEHQQELRELNRALAASTVARLAETLRDRYEGLENVLAHLKAVECDVVENAEAFLGSGRDSNSLSLASRRALAEAQNLDRYRVNVLVSRQQGQGAPVIVEERPGVGHLLGRIEHRQLFGALVTDFTLIKGGALHQANGGYLLLDALKVLQQPYAWEALKSALRTRVVRIESLAEALGFGSTSTLEPQPIPLDVKVVLMGDRPLYMLLSSLDSDFRELFKVAADFADDLPRSPESDRAYAQLVASIARSNALKALDAAAVARVLEHAARMAGDSQKVSAHIGPLADVLREADHWATQDGRSLIGRDDVERALKAQDRRADRVRERLLEEIQRGTLLISTQGAVVGQVNGLAVARLGEFEFGYPVRITACTRLGKGEVVDIERESTLGGPLHSKGVLILSGLLGSRYTQDKPFSLSASVVFEQSYGPIEGDSASAAELFALLSALSQLPLSQSMAVTGSIDQHGRIQPIGGVNEKIEGFFDVCKQAGLSGQQAVIIPKSNVKHLMLRRDVVHAVELGQFRIWAIETVDQGLELLTGVSAGAPGPDGVFPPESANGRVAARLAALAERARAFGAGDKRLPSRSKS